MTCRRCPTIQATIKRAVSGWKPVLTDPLYRQIAHHLRCYIDSGYFPAGSLLPTENELASAFGVSRQTVRQAIGTLRNSGHLLARKGVGTCVVPKPAMGSNCFISAPRSEFVEVSNGTELVISLNEQISAKGKLAVELGCRSGRKFLHMTGVRYRTANHYPHSWNEVYIDARFGRAVHGVKISQSAICHLIERHTGESVQEIQQDIGPVKISLEIAEIIKSNPGDLGLEVTRRYFGSGRRLIEYSVQILPADRFTYTTTLRAKT